MSRALPPPSLHATEPHPLPEPHPSLHIGSCSRQQFLARIPAAFLAATPKRYKNYYDITSCQHCCLAPSTESVPHPLPAHQHHLSPTSPEAREPDCAHWAHRPLPVHVPHHGGEGGRPGQLAREGGHEEVRHLGRSLPIPASHGM